MNDKLQGHDAEVIAIDEFAALDEIRQNMIDEVKKGAMFYSPILRLDEYASRLDQMGKWAMEYGLGSPQKFALIFGELMTRILGGAKWRHYWIVMPIIALTLLRLLDVSFRTFWTCVVTRTNILIPKKVLLDKLTGLNGFP